LRGFIQRRVAAFHNPVKLAAALRQQAGRFWRFRARGFRVLCQIDEGKRAVLVLSLEQPPAGSEQEQSGEAPDGASDASPEEALPQTVCRRVIEVTIGYGPVIDPTRLLTIY